MMSYDIIMLGYRDSYCNGDTTTNKPHTTFSLHGLLLLSLCLLIILSILLCVEDDI